MLINSLRTVAVIAVFALAAPARGQWNEQTLESFRNLSPTGDSPQGHLIQGQDGALYGLTSAGGNNNGGTVFKVNVDGSGFTVLHAFLWLQEGGFPRGGLLQTTNGTLYGTTYSSGIHGGGTLFKINPDGSQFTILHSFGTDAKDGSYTFSGVSQGRDGNLYGTTTHGGTNNQGTIYKFNPVGGAYTVIHTFATNDGYGLSPDAGVIQGSDGLLYGTTPQAGPNGSGTLYRLHPDGSGYTVIHTFGVDQDARVPYCSLIQGADGALYGTSWSGGATYNGTVFKLNLDGTDFTILYSFDDMTDPETPQAGLVQGVEGNLYGTGYGGGSSGGGAVFELSTNGSAFAVLHDFTEDNKGGNSPDAPLIQGKDGALYGTTLFGGTSGNGTVFRLAPSPPVVTSQPTSQTAYANSMASFSVTASGTAPFSYFWQRNNAFIAGGTNEVYTDTNVLVSDSGAQFNCVVSNAYGTATSSNATLTVLTAGAGFIHFDDVPDLDFGTALTNGYYGLTWSNLYVLDAFDYPYPSGYAVGMISASNVVFNSYGASAVISASTPFNFLSAWLTAAWNQNLALQTLGYNGSILLYSNVYALSATSPTLIKFNYLGINQIRFTTSGGYAWPPYNHNSATQFALDDVTLGALNPVITRVARAGASVQITLSGSSGDIYHVLASTNLANWQTVALVTNFLGTVQFTDPGTNHYNRRFYQFVRP